MCKPAISAIKNLSGKNPTVVFVPSRKVAGIFANDLRVFAESIGDSKRFLNCDSSDIEPHLQSIGHKETRKLLGLGIGLYHEGLLEKERNILMHLYKSGAIQILIVTHKLCW